MAAPMEKTRYPGIYRRGSKWVATWHVPGVGGRKRAFPTLALARQWKKKMEVEIHSGEYEERSRVKFRAYAEQWVEAYQGRGRNGFREHTRRDYRRDLERYAYPYFDGRLGRRLTSITPQDVAGWLRWLCDEVEQGKRRTAELEQWRRDLVELKAERRAAATEAERDALSAQITRMARSKPRGAGKPVRLSDGTIRRVLAPVQGCLRTAREEGLIRHNPADKTSLPHRPKVEGDEREEVRALTAEQVSLVVDLVPATHRTFFRLLAASGLRWSEAHPLRWQDLELNGSTPHIKVRRARVEGDIGQPKSKYGRRDVPLSSTLVDELRRRRSAAEGDADEDLVFPSGKGGFMDHSNMLRNVLRPAAEEAGVPWVGFHTFRHTCASLLFDRGTNAVKVQRWIGHHSPEFTLKKYVHLLDEQIAEPLELDGPGVASKVGRDPGETEGNDLEAELAEFGMNMGERAPQGIPG